MATKRNSRGLRTERESAKRPPTKPKLPPVVHVWDPSLEPTPTLKRQEERIPSVEYLAAFLGQPEEVWSDTPPSQLFEAFRSAIKTTGLATEGITFRVIVPTDEAWTKEQLGDRILALLKRLPDERNTAFITLDLTKHGKLRESEDHGEGGVAQRSHENKSIAAPDSQAAVDVMDLLRQATLPRISVEALTEVLTGARKNPPEDPKAFVRKFNQALDACGWKILLANGKLARLTTQYSGQKEHILFYVLGAGPKGGFPLKTKSRKSPAEPTPRIVPVCRKAHGEYVQVEE